MKKYLAACLLAGALWGIGAPPVQALTEQAPPQAYQSRKSLRQVLGDVYLHHPALLSARDELDAVMEQDPQAKAGWRPSLDAESGIYKSHIDNSNFSGADGATTKHFSLNLEQPLYRGGRTTAETARAGENIDAARAILIKREQDLFLDTATAYMNVIRDRRVAALRRENVSLLAQEHLAAQEQFDMGYLTRTDVTQAAARRAQAESEMTAAEGAVGRSEAAFAEIAGYAPPEYLYIPDIVFNIPSDVAGMITAAMDNNPEVRIAAHRHKAMEHDINVKESILYPQVSAYASYDKQYDPQPGIVDDSATQTIGLRATLALYEGGANRSRVREAKSMAYKYGHDIDATKRRIARDVVRYQRAYATARAESAFRETEIAAKQSALDGVREEAKMGQRRMLDILDADMEVVDSKIALVQAQHNEYTAYFALAASTGYMTPENLDLAVLLHRDATGMGLDGPKLLARPRE